MAYKVLKSFAGSPDGRHAVDYKAGDTVELTPSLATVALKEKWVKEIVVKAKPEPEADAPAVDTPAPEAAQAAE